ncbi:MAG TPA: hypothetical protein VGI93_00580 [Steroidobacteraceae bacterium]|jgi:hypothetical protein
MIRSLALTLLIAVGGAALAQSSDGTEDFATVKSQIVARLNKELACVEAATTMEELHACRPKPPGGHPPGPPPN